MVIETDPQSHAWVPPGVFPIAGADAASPVPNPPEAGPSARPPDGLFPSEAAMPLLTDLYELTMAAGYFLHGKRQRVAFEAHVRALPADRSFLLAAGLEQVLHYVLHLRFQEDAIHWLRSQPPFQTLPAEFFEYLRAFRFGGNIWAVPEGTVVFAGEPLIRVEADLVEAQVLETYLLTCLNLQTLVASKAARIRLAARGRPFVDFGARRAHGPQAGLLAARASIIGGAGGTSNVEAARRLGVPAVGTMAHSWVMAFDNESQAFSAYSETFPRHTVCLVDTFDTLAGARTAAQVVQDKLMGVRLDSGDLLTLSRRVRQILDENGCAHARILASSDLNEFTIDRLLQAGAPIDSFGVGTDMVTSKDAPALSAVYKLVAMEEPSGQWRAVVKRSKDKATLGGRKQIWREYDATGHMTEDVLALPEEQQPGRSLLRPFVRDGRLIAELPDVRQIAERAAREVEALPEAARALRGTYAYPVGISRALQAAQPHQ